MTTLINGRHESVSHTVHHPQGATDFMVSRKYSQLEFLAYGGFGLVCKATNAETNTLVAIKLIDLQKSPRILSVLRETKISKYLTVNKSKAVVELRDIEIPAIKNNRNIWEFNTVYLIYEYMHSDLHQIIKSEGIQLKDEDYRRLLAQMLFGLRDVHHANILHRDLKPSNLLVDSEGAQKLKICDFGLARAMKTSHSHRVNRVLGTSPFDDDKTTTVERKIITMKALEDIKAVDNRKSLSYEDTRTMKKEREINGLTNGLGTAGYRSPEMTLGCVAYEKASDIWAIGCVFAEMVKKTRLFQVKSGGTNEDDEFNTIISKMGSSFITGNLKFIDNKDGLKLANKKIAQSIIGSELSEFNGSLHPQGIKLMNELLRFDPNQRIKAQNALKSAYLEDTYKELSKEFKHLDLFEQFEKQEEQQQSEEQLKEKIWKEMQDFHGYTKKTEPKADEKNKRQRTL